MAHNQSPDLDNLLVVAIICALGRKTLPPICRIEIYRKHYRKDMGGSRILLGGLPTAAGDVGLVAGYENYRRKWS